MPDTYSITGEGEIWEGATQKLILWKRQQRFWQANGEIDFYPIRDIQSGVACTLTDNQWEQKWILGDLKKSSSPLGYLQQKHSLIKGSLRIISEEELNTILQREGEK